MSKIRSGGFAPLTLTGDSVPWTPAGAYRCAEATPEIFQYFSGYTKISDNLFKEEEFCLNIKKISNARGCQIFEE